MSKLNKYSAAKAASPASVDLLENTQNRKKALIKFGSVTVFSAIVLIFMSIAWFSMNKETGTDGMSIKAGTDLFEIGTYGTSGTRYDSLLTALAPEYETGTSGTIEGTEYYMTGGSAGSIKLRYSTGDSEIAPGGNGNLSLYVIPKVNDSFDVKVTLNVVAYAEIEKYTTSVNAESGETEYSPVYKTDENGNEIVDTDIFEITTLSDFTTKAAAANNLQAVTNAAEYISAANYLKGHIVFFGGEGDTTNAAESARYYYTTPYKDREISKTIPAGNQGKAVNVPIYWMWTNTLGQLALPDNVSGKRSGYPVLADSDIDKSDIISYLTTNRADIFANNSETTSDYISAVSTHVNTSADFNTTAFNNLSTGYNEADRLIGTRVAYFLIEVTVSSGN